MENNIKHKKNSISKQTDNSEIDSYTLREICPVETSISIIGDKWKILIVRELIRHKDKKLRFVELRKNINRISDKMLSQNLKKLEEDGIIQKDSYAEVPPRVEYSLTELGLTLRPVIKELYEWGLNFQKNHPDSPHSHQKIK